ncbi:hypothetical protein CGRA01v4_11787 [Colletotrichum graminicola]|uniref:Transcription factor TFIIIC triple barrel domain-containing protein n=1 Tax=Colletotrichum graminicola (strain M1.001 / M2 / FGSC 10212) TaxID=645133 RepID=E3QBV8_COLGM|nr:uncharacterized protein GLRG_03337 [Colletotrichum graminicola M1.001]EFQ28193.1 hypothetical protein GLRG_03337 [Colletotrichum graminicola M1.001]WDK20500.1 hypothetical protein CGRA01v4_11787 [Colletotrichum graminicola]
MATNAPTSSVAPVVAATAPADQPSRAPTDPEDGDESEWEYEYSTTETETYYLTVDLSIPQLLRRKRNTPVSGRGGYHYKHWAGPHRKPDEPKHHRILSDDENDDKPTAEPEEDEDIDQGQVEPNTDGFDADFESDPAADIQILDLHSDKPMFAYKGKVFEGQWARNLGTEVIFTEHDDQDPLPALRHLPGGVDMLAASWSRINTTERRLEPKHEAAAKDDPLKEIRRQHGIHIPITADKTGERKRQTRFLENLMALKVKRGEKDEVTVYAHAARKAVNEGTNSRRKRRKSLPEGQSRKRRGRGGGVRRRGGPLAMEVGFESKAEPGDSAEAAGPRDGTLSTPTPTTWADLGGRSETVDTVAGPNDEDDGSEDDSEEYDGGDLE